MRLSLSTFSALCALQVLGVSADTGCIVGCTDTQMANYATFGCGSAAEAACLCNKPDFVAAVNGCAAPGCGATGVDVQNYLAGAQCQGIIQVGSAEPSTAAAATSEAAATTPAEAATTAPPTTTSEAAATTEVPSSTEVSTSSPEAVTTSETPSSTSVPETTQESSTSATPTPTAETTESAESTATETPSAAATSESEATTTSAAASATSTSSESAAGKSSGLSSAAQAGIGIGVGAVVLALLGVGLCFFMKSRRNQKQRRTQSLEISQPLPAGGRHYGSGDGYAEKNAYDMDLIANRYEDMVPRATPRNMV